MEIRKYTCYTPEEQLQYEMLTDKQRLYVDYRVQGMAKKDAYKASGFMHKNPAQAAYVLEREKPIVAQLIKKRLCVNNAKAIAMQEGVAAERINALAEVEDAEKKMSAIDQMPPEMAKQVKFYRDIANGKTTSVKTTTTKDANGNIIGIKVEETKDVSLQMKARKELDTLLGLSSQLAQVGQIKADTVTINIVDASRKDANGMPDTYEADEIGADFSIEDDNN